MKLRILGSGTSSGVPRIGNDWGACDPDNPRNLRSRASIMVSLGGFRILVDTSPDMRLQLLDAGVPVPTVAARLGHADGTTTMKIYAHRTRRADEQAARVVAEFLAEPD